MTGFFKIQNRNTFKFKKKKSSKLKTVVFTQNVSSSSGNTSKSLTNENTVIHNTENSEGSR